MNFNELPRDPARILELMREEEGPQKIARLALLCLWLAGQRDDPRKSSSGPGGAKPLEHLWRMLEKVQREKQPTVTTTSHLAHLTSYYPPPNQKKAPPNTESKANIDAIFKEARAAANPIRRHAVICQGLMHLAKQGVPQYLLQPLIDYLAEHVAPQEKEFQYDDTLEALMRAGEISGALKVLNGLKISPRMMSFRRIRCAKILIELDQPEKARETLKPLWAAPGQLADEVVRSMSLAECYAYLGDAQTARALAPKDSLNLEYLIAWQQYFSGKAVDIAPILAKTDEIAEIEPPKSRAAAQTDRVSFLMRIEKHEAALGLLPEVQATLLAIPLWGKLEFRVGDAVEALLPYAEKHKAAIYPFARDLLMRKAMDESENGGLWPMAQVVSGLSWLIVRWASEVDGLIDFLKAWHNQRVG